MKLNYTNITLLSDEVALRRVSVSFSLQNAKVILLMIVWCVSEHLLNISGCINLCYTHLKSYQIGHRQQSSAAISLCARSSIRIVQCVGLIGGGTSWNIIWAAGFDIEGSGSGAVYSVIGGARQACHQHSALKAHRNVVVAFLTPVTTTGINRSDMSRRETPPFLNIAFIYLSPWQTLFLCVIHQ